MTQALTSAALTTALTHFVWQGALVAFLLWVALGLLRDRSANARYVVSCAALALMAVLPLITAWVVYQRPIVASTAEILAAIPAAASAAAPRIDQWLVPAWALGVLLFSLRLLWGCGQVAAIRRRGEPADAPLLAMVTGLAQRMRLDRPVRVLISAIAEGPSAVGWIRPVILLPAATVLGLTADQLEAVLAHELAHIRRHDYLVNILQMLLETVLFYHPAVWWTSARIRHERELCCDDEAVACCGDALCYARALTTLERLRITTPRLALGSTGGSMLYRIERLVGVAKYQSAPSRWPGVLAICLGLAVFAVNTNWAQGQAQPKALDEPGVKTDLGKSTVTDRTPVEYPEAAREKKVEGTVVVEATVDKSGAVNDARVVSGPQELRKAALQSVLEWHFTPESGGTKRRVSIDFQTPPPGSQGTVGSLLRAEQGYKDQQQLEQEIQQLKAALDESRTSLVSQGIASADQEYRAAVQEVAALKAKLDASQRAQDLEATSRDRIAALTERQALNKGTADFLRQQLEEGQQNAERERQRIQDRLKEVQAQVALEERQADLILNCSPDDAAIRCTLEPELQALRAKMAETRSLDARLKDQEQQLRVQTDTWKAQMAELRAQLEALRAQLQEQQRATQK
jgi:TonB family protein